MSNLQVLVIEDDQDVQLGYVQALGLDGIQAQGFDSVEKARRSIGRDFAGIIVSDIRLPGMDGLAFMQELLADDPDLPVILITGHGDIAMAVQAMRDGAYDFIQKPFLPQVLVSVVQRALEKRRLALEVRQLRKQLAAYGGLESRLIGNSNVMAELRHLVQGVAATPTDVLINGETGAGKELLARCLHDLSGRTGPFVALNCGGLPETLFDSEMFGHEAGAFSGPASNASARSNTPSTARCFWTKSKA
jgi:two-component system C4-dicarboxylate transport response regulator DctD